MLRYLCDTVRYGFIYVSSGEVKLHGYAGFDWEGSVVDICDTSECCFSLGLSMVSWFSWKQTSVALSTKEVEYTTTCVAMCEAVWLCKLLAKLFDHELETTLIDYDDESCAKAFGESYIP